MREQLEAHMHDKQRMDEIRQVSERLCPSPDRAVRKAWSHLVVGLARSYAERVAAAPIDLAEELMLEAQSSQRHLKNIDFLLGIENGDDSGPRELGSDDESTRLINLLISERDAGLVRIAAMEGSPTLPHLDSGQRHLLRLAIERASVSDSTVGSELRRLAQAWHGHPKAVAVLAHFAAEVARREYVDIENRTD